MRQSMLREIFLAKVSHKVFDRSNFFFAPGIRTWGCAHGLTGFTEASPGGHNDSHETFDWRNYFFLLLPRRWSTAAGKSACAEGCSKAGIEIGCLKIGSRDSFPFRGSLAMNDSIGGFFSRRPCS